jgi:hypothetical protein
MMPSDKVHKSLTTSAKSFSKQPSFKVTSKKVDSLKFIMLSGTSSAGKTSIMNALCKHQNDAVQLGIDDFFEQIALPNLIKAKLPQDYEVLRHAFADHILSLVCDPGASIDEILEKRPGIFREDSFPEQRALARALLADKTEGSFCHRFKAELRNWDPTEEHFLALLEKFHQGKTVIFDTCSPNEFFTFLNKHGIQVEDKVNHILVYLPLQVLLERVHGRNDKAEISGNLKDKRSLTGVIGSFMDHYRPIQNRSDVKVDRIKQSDIVALFDRYAEQINEENKRNRVPVTLESFLSYFGFTEGVKEVGITTKFHIPQGILSTKQQTPSESAYQLRTSKFTKLG